MQIKLKLIEIRQESPDIKSFRFDPEPKFTYQAGQFLKYTLPHQNPDDRGSLRYFTISAAPEEGFVQFTTRFSQKSSSFKSALTRLKVGDVLDASGPGGNFTFPDLEQKAVFIAGGIGITPFRSILVDLAVKNINPNITLLYASKNPNFAFKELFDALAQKHSNFKVVYTVDQPSLNWQGEVGQIDPEFIKKHVSDWDSPDLVYYVSGPEPMVEMFGNMLESMGIPKERFKQDFFPGYQR